MDRVGPGFVLDLFLFMLIIIVCIAILLGLRALMDRWQARRKSDRALIEIVDVLREHDDQVKTTLTELTTLYVEAYRMAAENDVPDDKGAA